MNMGNTFKRILAMVLALTMVLSYVPFNTFATETETGTETQTEGTTQESQPVADGEPDAQAETEGSTSITGTITEDMVWKDGAVIGGVTLSGKVTITVKGTVTVAGTIRLSPDAISEVTFNGEGNAKLIRGGDFTGQMFYAEGVSGNFQNLTFNNITLDGGAVWTGDVDKTLNRGTINEGVKATGSVLYLVYANADLNYSTLQNHDDSTGEKANAVFLRYYSTIDFNNSVVKNNNSVSTYYRGGVITVRQGGTVKTSNAEVYGNSGAAGGFFGISSTGSFGGVAEVYNSKFYNNYSDNGAVFLMQCNSNRGYLKIDGCEFYNNASKTAVLTEWAYSRPFIISNSSFHDNECAVWDCHTDPVLDISGKIVVEEDADYTKYLFETPLVLTGALAEGSSIAMSEASITKLGGCIFVGNGDYVVTESDMAKLVLPEGYQVVIVDVTGDGIGDAVAVKSENELTEVKLTLKDNADPAASAEGTVYSEIDCLPVNPFAHDGLTFAGWVDAGDNAVAKQKFTESATLTVIWKIEAPVVTLGRKDQGANINTLVATITNKYDSITYTYQWYKDGAAIEGATSSEYTITEEASYKCVVTASLEGLESVTGEKSATASLKEVPKNYVAQVGDDKFETLAAAITAAQAGDTITFLADITEDVTVDEAVIIDGADKTYTGKMSVTASVTIKNVNFDGKGYNGYAVETRSAAAVVIEDCTAKSYGYGFLQVVSNNNTLTVKNVTVSDCNYGVKVDYSNAVVLENVKLDCAVAGLLNSNYGKKTITIKNSEMSILGTWTRNDTTKTTYVFEGANSIDEFVIDEAIDVFKLAKDATLTAPNEINVTTDVENGTVIYENGAYSVLVDPTIGKVAEVNGEYFATLQAAVEAANAIEGGATVTLLKDVTLGEQLTITGNVTISGAYTITRDAAYTGTLFTVNAGATLTLDGGLVIDGANEWVFNEEGYNAALEANDGTEYSTFAFAASEEGAPVAKARMFVVNGSLVMNSVTVQNHMGNSNCGLIGVNAAATLTLNNGATLKHNATSHSSVVANVAAGGSVTINDGVLITGNYYAKNGGIFQSAGLITMNGGEISHNVGVNTNGTAAMMAQNNAKFVMNGGLICSNSSVRGSGAGRNAAIYLHSTGIMEMNGGSICHNIGCGYGGIDTNQTNSKLTITGGYVGDNVSMNGNATADVNMYNKELVAISGGSYTQDVSQWLAPNTGLAYDEETGVYAVVTEKLYKLHLTDPATNAPATIPYIEGNDLAALVEYGKLFYADYYKMELEVLYNVKIDKTVVIDYPMTINLNGKTITAAAGVDPMFRIESDVVVTGEGKLDARNGVAYVFILGKPDGTKGNLTIENGTFYGETTVASVTNGKLTINGGKFAVNPYEESYDYLLNCIDANYKNGTAVIEVKGGTFYKFNPADNEAEIGDHTNFVAEGYEVSVDGDYYTVNKAKVYVAQVGETKYESLQAAINAVQNGDTVVLLTDCDEDVTINQVKNVVFTLDGADKTYSGTITLNGTGYAGAQGQGLTIKNLNFVVDGYGIYAYTKNNYARNVTVDGCTFTGTDGENYDYGIGLRHVYDITVKNTTGSNLFDLVYGGGAVTGFTAENVTVENSNNGIWLSYPTGTINLTNVTTTNSENVGVGFYNYAQGTVTFTDCDIDLIAYTEKGTKALTLVFNDAENTLDTGETNSMLTIVLNNMDATLTAAEGLNVTTSVENETVVYENGVYKVGVKNYVAQVGETKYTSLKEALEACTNGETVELIADIVYDADDVVYAHGGATGFGDYDQYNPAIIYIGGTRVDGVNSPSNVNAVLDLNGHTITNNANAYLFLFMDNCKITFTGEGTVQGNTNAPLIWSTGTDTVVTIEGGKYSIGEYGSLAWATHSGDLVIKGGEFSTTAEDASSLIMRNEHNRQNSEYFISGKSTVTVTGGTFKGFNPEKMLDDSKTPAFEFNAVAEGYAAIYDEAQDTYTVFDYIKWIKAELLAGNDVTLDRDIVVDGSDIESIPDPVNGNGKYPNYGIFNVYGDTVTIDLNGFDVTYNGHEDFEWNGKTYNSCTVAHGLFFANAGANLTIKDSKGTSDITVYGLASGAYAAAPNTVLTIEGGNWKNVGCAECGGTNIFLYPLQGATLNITGGTFEQALDAEGESYLIVEHGGEYKGATIDYSLTNVEITGGTFVGMNPAEIKYFQQTADNKLVMGETTNGCAKGYKAEQNEDGTWSVVPNMIFEMHLVDANGEAHWLSPMSGNDINSLIETCNVWYDTLQGTYSFTLKVLESYELDETVLATFPMTIDLCGNTLTVAETMNATPAIRVLSDVTVTNGTVDATAGTSTYAFIVGNSTTAGTLTIVDGTYKGSVSVASVTKGTLNISGGNFESTAYNGAYEFQLNCIDANYKDGSAVINVTGGTFVGFNPENNAAEGAGTNFVAEGYGVEQDGENYIVKPVITVTFDNLTMVEGNELPEFTWTSNFTEVSEDGEMLVVGNPEVTINGVGEYEITAEAYVFMSDKYIVEVVPGTLTVVEAVAEANGVVYGSIEAAINAVATNNSEPVTIKVLKDHVIDTKGESYAVIRVDGKNVKIDLNGCTVTFDYTDNDNVSAIYASLYVGPIRVGSSFGGGTLVICDSSEAKTGTIYNKGDNGTSRIVWIATNGTATIESGNFVNEQKDTMFYTSVTNGYYVKDTVLTIKGGTFKQEGLVDGIDNDCFNMQDATASKQDIVLTGGTFYYESPEAGRQNDWEVTIAEGYEVVDNGNDTWTVQEKQVVALAKLETMAVSAEAEVVLIMRMTIAEELLNDENAVVIVTEAGNRITGADQVTTYTMAEVKAMGTDTKGRYSFRTGIASGEMTGTVSIQIKDGEGNFVNIADYKSDKIDTVVTRTVLDYVRLAMVTNDQDLKNLMIGMVTYGGYAQTYYNVDAENPAYNVLSEFGVEVPDISVVTADSIDQAITISGADIGITYKSQKLGLDSRIYMSSLFVLDEDADINDYKFVLTYTENNQEKTKEITPVKDGAGYRIVIEDIPAAYFDYMYKVTVTKVSTGETYEVACSVMAWVKRCINAADTQPEALVNMAKAMYLYNQAANNYFHK